MSKTKRISIIALNIALAFVLSYLETLIPLNFGIPGIKIGLANIVVVSALYTLPRRDAFFISMVRILISGLVFSGAFSLLYSFAGGVISFTCRCFWQSAQCAVRRSVRQVQSSQKE